MSAGDIAALGLQIDSSQTTAATVALDKFAVAGAAAGKAADTLAASGAKSVAATVALQTAAAPAAAATEALATASGHAAGAHGGMSTQAMAAMHSVRSMTEQIAMGIPPTQLLASHIGQLSYAASGPGGLTGAFTEVAGLLGGLLTPMRLAGVAAVALAAGGVYVATSWSNSQHQIELSLTGIGKASGATVDDINNIALASASAGKLSVTASSEIASSLAQTGKISKDLFGSAIEVTRDYAKIIGTDTTKAADSLAKALVDPVKGADQLNERLGFLDFSTQNLIKSLVTQNNVTAAQKIILDGVKSSTAGAADSASGLSKVWDNVSTNFSTGTSFIGKFLSGSSSDLDKFDQSIAKINQIKGQISSLQSNKTLQDSPLFSSAMDGLVSKLHQAQDESEQLGNKLATAADEMRKVQTSADSLRIGPVLNSLVPEVSTRRNLADINTAVQSSPFNPSNSLTPEQDSLAKARSQSIADSYLTIGEAASKASDLQLKAIDAKSPSQRADIAYQQTMISLAGQNLSLSEKQGLASKAAAVASAQASYQLTQAAKDRLRSANDNIGATQIDINSIGQTVGQVALLKANWQSYTALRTEADHNHTAFDQAQYDRLTKINGQYATQVQLLEKAKVDSDIKFNHDTALFTSDDVAIAQQLKGLYPNVTTALNSAEASQIRFNNGLKQLSDLGQQVNSGFFVDFETGLRNGQSGWQSFQTAGVNALGKIADKLASMAADNLWASAFGGTSGGSLMSLFGLGGSGSTATMTAAGDLGAGTGGLQFPMFASGGYTGPGSKNEPAGIVHKGEYVIDAATTSRIGVSRLNALRGYADGGLVVPSGVSVPSMPASAGNDNRSGGHTHVTVGIEMNANGEWQAYVKNISQQTTAQGVSSFAASPQFVDHVAYATTIGRTQRKI